ncbi:hypothetical protein D5086_009993 [Populus alba]|uniref:Myelin-associated oligodendrocyte basic protein n=2 Tax=Populus alba TaxID=43335 RepID=A0A4U5QJH3_POPAL|nr:uncharacterized protein LOC118051370 [Populus alba]TKS10828.1 hypothetical protein D5086_0000078930 [Populus alba]
MATASLIESSPLKWKQAFPFQPQPPLLTPNHYPYLVPLKPPKFTSKCISQLPILNPNSKNNNGPFPISPSITKPISQNLSKPPTSKNPLEIIYETMLKALDILKKPAIAAILIGVLLLHDPNSAFAASGGRIGGNSFSRRSSSEYSSRSYSVPRGGSSGFSYSVPYYAPSPFGGGGVYVGPAVGVGVGAGSSLFFILAGFAAFMLVSGFLSDRNEGGVLTAAEKTTVLKLQVGLLGMGRSLQRDLDRIAEVADTSSSEGLNYVLTETSLALLRHPDYCISGYSFVDVKRSMEDGEKRFNQLSIEERGKFDEETLVNVNSIKRQSTSSKRSNGFSNEYIVITILVAAEGVYKLPTINGSGDLKEALQKLGSIPASKILAVEVLWTPQNENDTLSERELLEDYPLLRPL